MDEKILGTTAASFVIIIGFVRTFIARTSGGDCDCHNSSSKDAAEKPIGNQNPQTSALVSLPVEVDVLAELWAAEKIVGKDVTLRNLFSKVAQGQSMITFDRFYSACKTLKVQLDEKEYKRVFDSCDQDKSGGITFHEFKMSILYGRLIMAVASMAHLRTEFKVPENYDFLKCTNANYQASDFKFYGKYHDIRAKRDYKYHVNYTKERQEWQDHVIETVVLRDEAQENPWIVYSCGAMGAGKGYTMRWMSAHGYFPLEKVVRIDPDHFKNVMPEWEGYVKMDRERGTFKAGGLTHRESGYLQEIAQEIALRSRRNIWVDGSLRDGDWFCKVFDDIRARFPNYKIGIFYVYASEEIVRARIKERGEKTGRYISEKQIQESLRAPQESLNKLTSKVDFIARIRNRKTPILESFEVVDRSQCWHRVKQYAANTSAINSFPNYLPPMSVMPTEIDHFLVKIVNAKEGIIEIKSSKHDVVLMKHIKHTSLHLSPRARITLQGKAKQLACIPNEARTFAFVYPSTGMIKRWVSLSDAVQDGVLSIGVAHLYQNGGYIYYDETDKVVGVNFLLGQALGNPAPFSKTNSIKTRIQFHTPYVLPYEAIKTIEHSRWRPVQRPDMRKRNCKFFAWIIPNEPIAGHSNPYGAFAYVWHDPKEKPSSRQEKLNRFFPIISSS